MIRLPQPSMVIQDAELLLRYTMQHTPPFIPATATLDDIIRTINAVFEPRSGPRPPATMECLVLSAHGEPAEIFLGAEHINASNVGRFAQAIRGRFRAIYIHACLVGRIQSETFTYVDRPRWGRDSGFGRWRRPYMMDTFTIVAGDGHAFCSTLAREAQARVHAATEVQVGGYEYTVFPLGWLDEYEGREVVYDAAGNLVEQHVRPSYDDARTSSSDTEAFGTRSCDTRDIGGTASWCRLAAPSR
jgi:hypothetical protein